MAGSTSLTGPSRRPSSGPISPRWLCFASTVMTPTRSSASSRLFTTRSHRGATSSSTITATATARPPSMLFASGGGYRRRSSGSTGAGRSWGRPSSTPRALSGAGPQVPVPAPGHGAVATKDLSVVVVFHNMRREAQRTLHSLSRRYQKGVDDLDYEVVVVENGSDPDPRLGEELVRSFGWEFRYVDMGDDAAPSPARALNRGIEFAGGRALALMIDGAHVLTPGVLMNGMLGLASYEPALVTTQQWYVGPGEQNETVAKGYNRDYEDRLFEEIAWPTDGYGLFDIGHFIGDRDWFEDQWESNCVFVRRTLIDQLGGMDERFDEPGGGFVNLDFFERMASSPSVTLVTILGEGSFHQLHGGTTTNVGEATARNELLDSFHDRYAELRGRRFALPRKEFHYVGSLPEPARRTKARRMGAPVYFRLAHVEGTDGRPPNPVPIPAELRTEFIDAFWRSKEWHSTTWLGRWTGKAPTDLLAYQDLLFRVRPDWVVETGSGGGGRALFLASVFELMGAGQVLSIDDTPVERLVEHPRITYIRRDPTDEEAVAAARETLGERPRVLLILGASKRDKLLATFDLYSPLVPVGSYAVFEDTILNGHPVWAGFGPGPWEAVGDISKRGEFVIDQTLERYGLTFNPNGFLKRER